MGSQFGSDTNESRGSGLMNLASTIALHGGGPGSGCNPEKGKCGRPSGTGVTTSEKDFVHDFADHWSGDHKSALSQYENDERLSSIIRNTKINKPLFRGLSATDASHFESIANRFTVGKTVDMGLTSFSKSGRVALTHAYDRDSFMDDHKNPTAHGVVLLQVDKGPRGVDVSKYSRYSEEKEVVSRGTYKVLSVVQKTRTVYGDKVPVITVRLKQVK